MLRTPQVMPSAQQRTRFCLLELWWVQYSVFLRRGGRRKLFRLKLYEAAIPPFPESISHHSFPGKALRRRENLIQSCTPTQGMTQDQRRSRSASHVAPLVGMDRRRFESSAARVVEVYEEDHILRALMMQHTMAHPSVCLPALSVCLPCLSVQPEARERHR